MLMFTLYSNYKFNWDLFDVAAMLGVVGTLGVFWQLVGVKYIVERYDGLSRLVEQFNAVEERA